MLLFERSERQKPRGQAGRFFRQEKYDWPSPSPRTLATSVLYAIVHHMRILAIETSCDETAVALLEIQGTTPSTYTVLGNALYSQAHLHAEFGGVFPTLAKREHSKNLTPLLLQALTQASLLTPASKPSVTKEQLDDIKKLLAREPETFAHLLLFFAQYERPPIDVIAVTHGPGLEPALWVGINFAKALAHIWGMPLVAVNHMEGHVVMAIAEHHGTTGTITFPQTPALAFLISGGHTEFVTTTDFSTYHNIGATRDDAIGEAFDKVARLLNLPYPGGPEISARAKVARERSITPPFSLPRPMVGSGDLDFSFSGIKTAVMYALKKLGTPTEEHILGIAREFEDAVTDVCEKKVARALQETDARTLIIGGGVAANTYIRERLAALAATHGVAFLACPPVHATDNALMIALAGYLLAQRKEWAEPSTLEARGNLSLSAA
jgi:N6-L-threonylcarbamoyladenine synthase